VRKLTSALYQLARVVNDLGALASGSPRRIGRRAVNKLIGRKLLGKIFLPWR